MRKLLMFVLLVFWSLPVSAQDALWSRTYGGSSEDWGWSVQQTTDSGYVVAGYTNSFGVGDYDVYLIKTNSVGDTLWSRTYGGSSDDGGRSVQQTPDGGYMVVGYTISFGAGLEDVYLIKTDSNGDTLWSRTYGGSGRERGESVQQTTDGGYIIVGYTTSFGVDRSFYLIKTNANGDTLWTRAYGTVLSDQAYSVQQTTDGGYIVAGATDDWSNEESDAYLIKTDSNGDTLWTRTYGGSSADGFRSVQQTTDGGYIVAGYTWSFGADYYCFYLIKTSSTGDPLWSRTYGPHFGWGMSVQQTIDGGYIMAGYGSGGYVVARGQDVFVTKTDSNGDILWTRTYGGSDDDWVFSVQQTIDGGYIVAEYVGLPGDNGDVMLTKLDSLGNACIGEFVSSTVTGVTDTLPSPVTSVTSPSTVVTICTTMVTSPVTEVTTVCIFLRGDCNGDGVINSADVVCLINCLFVPGAPCADPLWVGDCNCDGVTNSADVVYLINYLFVPGSPPPGC